jgi:hypothetical protein
MEHRGIRYAIRIGIAQRQWCVGIYPPDEGMPKERPVFGSRQEAQATARSMINALLKKPIGAAKKIEILNARPPYDLPERRSKLKWRSRGLAVVPADTLAAPGNRQDPALLGALPAKDGR